MKTRSNINKEELKKSSATQKRIRNLAIIFVLVIAARVYFKNPPPVQKPVRSKAQGKILPGMLSRMPASERAKLSPDLLAKFQEVDRNAARGMVTPPQEYLVKNTPKPIEAQSQSQPTSDLQIAKSDFIYEAQTSNIPKISEPVYIDQSKQMLILFRNGRHVKAQRATHREGQYQIEIDRSIAAKLPSTMIASLSSNAATWKEPLPSNYVELKPAPGITIRVQKNTAERISVQITGDEI